MKLKRQCPPETNLLKFFHMLYINFQLLKNKRRNSRTQGDVSDWPSWTNFLIALLTVYVRILYHHHLNVLRLLLCRLSNSWTKSSKSVFSASTLSIESRSVLPNLSLVMEFLVNIFTNFIFDKFISHEALLTGRVKAASNNQTQLFK